MPTVQHYYIMLDLAHNWMVTIQAINYCIALLESQKIVNFLLLLLSITCKDFKIDYSSAVKILALLFNLKFSCSLPI